MPTEPSLEHVAALMADRSRARMLVALLEGVERPASMLAASAGVSASTASEHLAKLVDSGWVAVRPSGRSKQYRIADDRVVAAVEALLALAGDTHPAGLTEVTKWQRLRTARTCYDHFAGFLGTDIFAGLIERDALVEVARPETSGGGLDRGTAHSAKVALGPRATEVFGEIGIDLQGLDAGRRPLIRVCIDWTEQRPHLAGALGAEVRKMIVTRGWAMPRHGRRDVHVRAPEQIAAWLRR